MMISLQRTLTKFIKNILLLYQKTARPFIGSRCRFYPSCSDYAIEAVESKGLSTGLKMAFWRVIRCNQWSKGGLDPVR